MSDCDKSGYVFVFSVEVVDYVVWVFWGDYDVIDVFWEFD